MTSPHAMAVVGTLVAILGIAGLVQLGCTPAEKAFGVPLHLGMGLTLLAVNVVQGVRNVL